MEVTRPYPRGGRTFDVGESIEVEAHVASSMEAASPPFGRRLTDEELDELTAPTPPLEDEDGEEEGEEEDEGAWPETGD